MTTTHLNDLQLTKEQVGQIENVAQLIHFFATLGYNVDDAIPLNHALLGLDSEDLQQQIRQIHRIASDPDGDLVIYLFVVRSVTVALSHTIARRFRERTEDALLVLTTEFESLDFVLLQKKIEKGTARGKSLRQIIRPRPLTVNRRNPDPVALRVLKRFTYTEADGIYQWDKLCSAYDVAEWAEPEFNNRALFSDYYLKNRLTDAKLSPEWAEDVRPIGRQVQQHLSQARQNYTKQPESVIRRGLYEPLFAALGFEFQEHKSGRSSDKAPDYFLLYDPADSSQPIAAALTYVWNRNLDNEDSRRDSDTGDKIPGALVVSLLENSPAPWVIVTNGKLWRLYSATASNKATNYYEVDLEEALGAPDQITFMKYWWLFFRREAFTGFLDKTLQESANYAKALGNRLKDRAFTQIFPHFAAGFIHNIRAESGNPQAGFSEESLQWIYEGTLTFLYRLMFVLYAESLDLLPLYEERGYRGLSLYKIKQEIAAAAGTLFDDAPGKLIKRYGTDSTELYERLTDLFSVIDSGDPALNLPTYNGGLFSQTNENGEFLADYKIPDQQLALGLDRLCRDVDDKTQALAFIDFKSLGVRQLGSIYEGLLEFKLHIAQEELAVVKEKGKEVYVPRQRLDQSARKRLDQSQRLVQSGSAYLENDKKERKATGSYYTPDYIVKYIVANTVGPVLARKFAELEPRLRQAQKQFRQHKAKVMARGNDQPADLFWNEPAMRQLADDCLNVRVLDPAMGSGHFLVEVVDFVSNRLIDFLNGWTENPVWGLLERTRSDIVADMERQKVTIDTDRLTRVALLKRAVLKRCVYGVDLNLMAVELAKVSLWLDAFTLGAPLSFLDHHLKQGNSLIGARVQEVRDALEAKPGQQLSLLARSKFTGMMLATDLMRQISYLSDNTVAQVSQSQQAYRDASDHLAPYKRLLDVYTSRWFGNEASKKGFEPVLEFLQRDDTQAWIENPNAARLPQKDYMNVRQVAETASRAAEEKSFFHWELEFPEVFFAPSQPGGQDVQLREDGGFDAIVGNPPYIDIKELPNQIVDYFFSRFESTQNRTNIYATFMENALHWTSKHGEVSMIVPNSWLTQSSYQKLKDNIFDSTHVHNLVRTPETVFESQKVETTVFCIEKRTPKNNDITTYVGYRDDMFIDEIDEKTAPFSGKKLQTIVGKHPGRLWSAYKDDDEILEKIESNTCTLLELCDFSLGLTPYDKYKGHTPQQIELQVFHENQKRDETFKPLLSGGDISRYSVVWNESNWISYGNWLGAPREQRFFNQPRILVKQIIDWTTKRIHAAFTSDELYNTQVAFNLLSKNELNLRYILAILNSSLMTYIHKRNFLDGTKIRFQKILIQDAKQFPIKSVTFSLAQEQRKNKAKDVITLLEKGYYERVLQNVEGLLNQNQLEIVYEVLVHLVEVMEALNSDCRNKQQEFLSQLEQRLHIKESDGLNSLVGKSDIQNYLGDYQKDEPEVTWDDFEYRLHQNRSRYAANLAQVKPQIQQAYEQSLAVLRPIKQQLAATDALIDQIVYKLYGLTDEEIELIERPAYEQALSDAKAKVSKDKQLLKDPEAAAEAIAETVLPAAKRLQSRIPQQAERARLDQDLPGWQQLPGDVPTFLLSGEYDLATRPEHLDFSATVISFAKAVESSLYTRLFLPFRDQGTYSDADCRNKFLQAFMRGEKHLTLGSYPIIMGSSKEAALRQFAASQFGNHAALFSEAGALGLLQDEGNIQLRNKAAHDELLTRENALTARQWALGILRFL